ncbi:DUF348 domain-containing protein [Nanchangia anserum]|uniref:ubiquitin-like domain-containing protein n=1 Tax=Nanchangia anserum TaxID=2692125 RepID=UPI0018839906|nr:ubiquitin-like domain-containing protein [Nanchangia anserum]QOX82207.1 DUF348 domain-containing protein [Nanchangia anserum]
MTTAWVPRAVSGAAVIGVVIAAGAGAAAFTVSPHDVTLVVDGARRSLSVGDGSVSDALAEAGVPVAAADDVVPARTQPVREKMTITLTHAQPAWVQEPGESVRPVVPLRARASPTRSFGFAKTIRRPS